MLLMIMKDKFKAAHIGLIAISVFALAVAYCVEYLMYVTPCPLCIYQRFPYLILIKLSVTALLIKGLSDYTTRYTTICIVLTLLCACLLAGYHTAVERGIVPPSAICSTLVRIPLHLSIEAVKAMFEHQTVTACTQVPLKIFGFSMTEWNLLLNTGLLVIYSWIMRRG